MPYAPYAGWVPCYGIVAVIETEACLLTLPSYVLPRVVRITSGARYAGVPTRLPGADWNFSCCSDTGTDNNTSVHIQTLDNKAALA